MIDPKPRREGVRVFLSHCLSTLLFLLLSSQVTGQQTIWSEDFTGETGSSTTTLTGDQWVATETTSGSSGTMSITSSAFRFMGNSSNGTYTCTWVSDPISIGGYTSITLSSYSDGSGGTSLPSVSMSNGTYSSGSFSPDGGATTTVITYSFSIAKNKYRTLDNIVLTGIVSCTPTTWYADTDGDGLGNPSSTTSACSQPAGYVADSTDLCDDTSACNYDVNSNANASCLTNDACGVCGGSGVDVDSDGVCDDADSCTNTTACNYLANPTAACSYTQQTWYEDADGDGLGDPAVSQVACAQPAGYVLDNTDSDPSLNPSDYAGTVLYPGDVYFSFAANALGSIGEDYVGFTILKDIAEGTKLVVSPSLAWSSNQWNVQDNSSTTAGTQWTAIEWTAPSGGVSAGTEVILFDIQKDVIGGDAYCDGGSSPIARSGDTFTLTTGEAAGTYVHLGPNNDYFTWNTPVSWMFQPDVAWDKDAMGSSANDGKCRHLHCLGYALDNASNSGTGTLIEGTSWESQLDPAYSFEDPLFYLSSAWKYNGGASANAFTTGTNTLITQSLSSAVSFTAANGATPSYTSTNTTDPADYDDYNLIPFDPNGCIALATTTTWDNLANAQGIVNPSGNSSLDILVDNGVSLVVDVSSEVTCKDITVTTGTFQSCDGNARTVAVSGNIALGTSATFEGGQGTLKLSGLTAQSIDANNYAEPGSTKFQLKNLTIENNKTASIKGHVKMKSGGALTFDASAQTDKLKIDSSVSSSLTFQSSTSGTAAIGACEVANFDDGVDQTFTFERFIPSDTDNSWVNIGAYVTGTTVSDWTSGVSGMLLFEYNEASYGSQAAGWNYLWDGTAVLTPGNGYMALVPSGVSGTISVTGKFEMGDVTLPLTFTDDPNQSDVTVDGWNLVSNPYPAPVNMVSVLAHTENALVTAYYLFDNTGAGSYVETLADGTGGAPTTLDVGQSIWVKVDQNTSITFKESDKVVGTSGTFVRELDPSFQGSIGLGIANDSEQWAHAFVRFDEAATAAFIPSEDALHLNTEVHSDLRVWMEAENGEHLSIQSAGSLENTPSLPLHVTSGAGGDVVFSMVEQETMPANLCAVIEDTETGERGQLGMDAFVVNLPANTLYEERFVLHFNAMPSLSLTSTVCDGLDVTELEGEWDAWSLTWSSDDGTASGEGMPYDLANGDYTFTYALPSVACANEVDVEVNAACLGDFNLNGERDIIDLLFLLAGLPGNNGAANIDFETADCDCDGVVTVSDMLTFLTVFASQCD